MRSLATTWRKNSKRAAALRTNAPNRGKERRSWRVLHVEIDEHFSASTSFRSWQELAGTMLETCMRSVKWFPARQDFRPDIVLVVLNKESVKRFLTGAGKNMTTYKKY